jgi:hypothetical protein
MNTYATAAYLAAALVAQSAAQADSLAHSSVSVYAGSISFSAMGTSDAARAADSNSPYIGCEVASDDANLSVIRCVAADAPGTDVYCSVAHPSQRAMDAVSGLGAASYLYIQGDNSGVCTYLSVENSVSLI